MDSVRLEEIENIWRMRKKHLGSKRQTCFIEDKDSNRDFFF